MGAIAEELFLKPEGAGRPFAVQMHAVVASIPEIKTLLLFAEAVIGARCLLGGNGAAWQSVAIEWTWHVFTSLERRLWRQPTRPRSIGWVRHMLFGLGR